ncbi:MAG: flavodoxin family protein [Ruminococcus sp.]|jgi:multimeric flavodoxin WrbA|nr:flavodoxin family protein [Ruminococcus sp.]
MKVLAINGSPRRDGNTAHMLRYVLDIVGKAGHETEFYQAGGKPVRGCLGCAVCWDKPGKCVQDDWINEIYPKMKEADAIIIGSPTYFADLTAEIKALIDRTGYLAMGEGGTLRRKIGAGVTAVRRAGGVHVLDSIQHFFLIQGMILPGSTYWNLSVACNPADFEADDEGLRTMANLADNINWLLEKLN